MLGHQDVLRDFLFPCARVHLSSELVPLVGIAFHQKTFSFFSSEFCEFFSLALLFWKGSQPFGEAHMSTAGRNDPCFSDYPFVVQDFLNEGEKQRVKRELFSLKWKVFSLKTTDGCKKST